MVDSAYKDYVIKRQSDQLDILIDGLAQSQRELRRERYKSAALFWTLVLAGGAALLWWSR